MSRARRFSLRCCVPEQLPRAEPLRVRKLPPDHYAGQRTSHEVRFLQFRSARNRIRRSKLTHCHLRRQHEDPRACPHLQVLGLLVVVAADAALIARVGHEIVAAPALRASSGKAARSTATSSKRSLRAAPPPPSPRAAPPPAGAEHHAVAIASSSAPPTPTPPVQQLLAALALLRGRRGGWGEPHDHHRFRRAGTEVQDKALFKLIYSRHRNRPSRIEKPTCFVIHYVALLCMCFFLHVCTYVRTNYASCTSRHDSCTRRLARSTIVASTSKSTDHSTSCYVYGIGTGGESGAIAIRDDRAVRDLPRFRFERSCDEIAIFLS